MRSSSKRTRPSVPSVRLSARQAKNPLGPLRAAIPRAQGQRSGQAHRRRLARPAAHGWGAGGQSYIAQADTDTTTATATVTGLVLVLAKPLSQALNDMRKTVPVPRKSGALPEAIGPSDDRAKGHAVG